jgi:hypothetical protein
MCYSTLLHLPPLPLCRRMLGSNPGLLRLWHWQSDGLTSRLDLIHKICLFQFFGMQKFTEFSKNLKNSLLAKITKIVIFRNLHTKHIFDTVLRKIFQTITLFLCIIIMQENSKIQHFNEFKHFPNLFPELFEFN